MWPVVWFSLIICIPSAVIYKSLWRSASEACWNALSSRRCLRFSCKRKTKGRNLGMQIMMFETFRLMESSQTAILPLVTTGVRNIWHSLSSSTVKTVLQHLHVCGNAPLSLHIPFVLCHSLKYWQDNCCYALFPLTLWSWIGDVLGYPRYSATLLQFPPRPGRHGDPDSAGDER